MRELVHESVRQLSWHVQRYRDARKTVARIARGRRDGFMKRNRPVESRGAAGNGESQLTLEMLSEAGLKKHL
jgi:hypothetical protein